MRKLTDQWIEMSDGKRICADVYLPDDDGAYPVLYAVSPYQKDLAHLPPVAVFRFRETGPIEYWVGRGYAYVFADQRGTGKSEGEFELFSVREQRDFYETVEWAGTQPWSNGKVAMIGESGFSVNQWLTAATCPPHLACAVIYNAFTDIYRDAIYHGGIFSMGFYNFWTVDNVRANAALGEGTAPRKGGVKTDLLGLALDHPADGPFWAERRTDVEKITVPTLVVAWWSNIGLHLRGTLEGYQRLGSEKRLLALSGMDSEERFYKPEFLDEKIAPWYDHFLKGTDNGVLENTPPVTIDVQNAGPRAEQEWPLKRAVPTPYYLSPEPSHAIESINKGTLTTKAPAIASMPTEFAYPRTDWTVTTTVIRNGIPQPVRGALSFITEPLEHDTEVTGPIKAVLYVESDQTDTEFFVKLSDQHPVPALKHMVMDAMAPDMPPPSNMVTRGWLKATHRRVDEARSTELRPYHDSLEPTPIEPGKIIRYDIEIWPTSYLFRKGHRIRLEISNGDSMVSDGLFHHYYGHKSGRDLYYHDAQHPSHVLLPIVPPTTH